jgi:hypothetical protein
MLQSNSLLRENNKQNEQFPFGVFHQLWNTAKIWLDQTLVSVAVKLQIIRADSWNNFAYYIAYKWYEQKLNKW